MTRISTHVFSTNKTAAGSKFELMHHDDYLYTRSPTSHSWEMKRKEFAASHLGSHCVRKLVNALSQVKPLEGRQSLCKVCQHRHDLKILIYPDCHRWMPHLIWQSQSWSAKESNSVALKVYYTQVKQIQAEATPIINKKPYLLQVLWLFLPDYICRWKHLLLLQHPKGCHHHDPSI
jgi:hypothetical protein